VVELATEIAEHTAGFDREGLDVVGEWPFNLPHKLIALCASRGAQSGDEQRQQLI
jgi:hypothetical protein